MVHEGIARNFGNKGHGTNFFKGRAFKIKKYRRYSSRNW